MGVVLIEHLNMKNGINLFGNRTETAVMKELQKIYDMNTYKPMDASTLTYQERKDALDLLLFITDKRNGYIKAREVAVGSKQRTYDGYDKRNGYSPILKTGSAFLTGVINAHYHRYV